MNGNPIQHRPRHLARITLCMLSACAAGAACKPSAPPAPEPSRAAATRPPDAPFSLDFRALEEVEIVRADPTAGSRWSARLRRLAGDGWEIASAPENEPLHDRRANGGIVQHLLDTLNGVRIQGKAPNGAAASLGLDPPLAVFRWKTRGDANASELWVGKPVGQSQPGFYARANGGEPVILTGPAFQRILNEIPSFAAVREIRMLPVSLDDVDELLCTDSGPARYAQRGGDTWMDAKDHPIAAGATIGDWLARLADARIAGFEPEAAIPTKPALDVTLRGREAEIARVRAWRSGKKWLAAVSTRPGGTLWLDEAVTPLLKCPKVLPNRPAR